MKKLIKFSEFSDHTINKVFIDTFIVMFISELSASVANVTDGLMVSNFLGEKMLAGHSMVSPFFGLVAIISGLLATGTQVSISKLIGKGEFKKADSVFTFSVIICTTLSLLFTIACLVFGNAFASFFGASYEDAELFNIVKSYLAGLSTGTIPLTLNCVLLPVMQINGDKKRAKYGLIITTVANCLFNYLSIFIFDLGIFGVGLGTSLSQWVCLIICLLHFTKKKLLCKFRIKGINLLTIKDVLIYGFPKATVRICNTLRPLIINRWILYLSTSSAMSAVGLNNSIRDFFRIPETAVALAVMLIAGVFYSEQDKHSLQKLVKMSLFFNISLNLFLSAVIFIFAPQLASIYVEPSTEVHMMAVICLRWSAMGLIFYALNEYFMDFILGTGRHKLVHICTFFERFVYACACALLLGMIFGIKGVFASFSVSEICFTVHVLITICIKNKRFPKNITDCMMLPEGFEISPDMTLEFSVTKLEQVTEVSQKIESFCKKRNVDKKRTMYASLCAEELVSNIVKHGFSDEKKHNIYIRVIYSNDDLIMRIRDDCKLFDIREKYDTIDNKDITSNIGIRLVMKMAKDVTYVNSLNMNTTIIKI